MDGISWFCQLELPDADVVPLKQGKDPDAGG
jgi:hypothetical protein